MKNSNLYYMFYVSIYLYYLVKIEKNTSEEFKAKIIDIIKKNLNDPNYFKFSWCNNLKFICESNNDVFFLELLNKLFYFRNILDEISLFYKSEKMPILIYDEPFFYDKLIINCYIKILLNLNYDIDEIKEKINKENLISNQKSLFESALKKENMNSINKENDFIEFFHLANKQLYKYDSFKEQNEEILDNPKNIMNSFEFFNQNKLLYFKSNSINEFKEIERNIVVNDIKNYAGIHQLKKEFISEFNRLLFEKLNESNINFKKLNDLKNVLSNDKEGIIFYKNFDLKKPIKNEGDYLCLNKINNMKTVPVVFNKFIIWEKDSIKIEYNLIKDKSEIRKLKNEEINDIINSKHETFDGFYNYKRKNNITQFITRDDLFNEIQNNYWYISTFYEYSITVDPSKIYLPFEG